MHGVDMLLQNLLPVLKTNLVAKDVATKHLAGRVVSTDWQLDQIKKLTPYKTNKNIVLNGYFTK